jgi:hypothetical protein
MVISGPEVLDNSVVIHRKISLANGFRERILAVTSSLLISSLLLVGVNTGTSWASSRDVQMASVKGPCSAKLVKTQASPLQAAAGTEGVKFDVLAKGSTQCWIAGIPRLVAYSPTGHQLAITEDALTVSDPFFKATVSHKIIIGSSRTGLSGFEFGDNPVGNHQCKTVRYFNIELKAQSWSVIGVIRAGVLRSFKVCTPLEIQNFH